MRGATHCKDDIKHYTFDGSNAGFKATKAGTFQADGNYTPYIADIGLRAAIYKLVGKDIPRTLGNLADTLGWPGEPAISTPSRPS